MESFDTKDCEVMESFDRKFEKFPSKDSELDEPVDVVLESFDRKFEKFPSKDSELDVPANELSESFDRKFRSSESKDSGFSVPADGVSESFDRKFESFESKDSNNTIRVTRKDSKLDGRSRLRSVKQIEAYKRNFGKGDSIEWKLRELDVRMRHLQSLVLRVVHVAPQHNPTKNVGFIEVPSKIA
jgi:hypothetical protein